MSQDIDANTWTPPRQQASTGSTLYTPTQTVVLRSIGKEDVDTFSVQEINAAIIKVGVHNKHGYSIRRDRKSEQHCHFCGEPTHDGAIPEAGRDPESRGNRPFAALRGGLPKPGLGDHLGQGHAEAPCRFSPKQHSISNPRGRINKADREKKEKEAPSLLLKARPFHVKLATLRDPERPGVTSPPPHLFQMSWDGS